MGRTHVHMQHVVDTYSQLKAKKRRDLKLKISKKLSFASKET